MNLIFYMSAVLAICSTAFAICAQKAVHALLYLLAALLALSLNLFVLGNELGALLLMIVYAGAIMVLFVFVVMLLNPAPLKTPNLNWFSFIKNFFGPLFFAFAIFSQFVFVLMHQDNLEFSYNVIDSKEVATALFTDGWYFVELFSLLLTAALIGAFHIGKRRQS